MTADSFSHSSVTTAPIDVVWAALDRPATWEAIGGVDRVFDPVFGEGGELGGFSFEVIAAGRRYPGEATPLRREELRVMAWAVDTPEVTGTTGVALEPAGDGTRIEVTLEVAAKSFLSRMFFPVIASAISSGLPESVEEFAAEIGSGA